MRLEQQRSTAPIGESPRWAIILAGGEGNRLKRWTRGPDGIAVPKQFCSLHGGSSLLRLALGRARYVVPRQHVAAVVAADHRRWWEPELPDLEPENVVVQPANRGTAAGILLPLLRVLERSPEASLAIFPSDHYVAHESVLRLAVEEAFLHAEQGSAACLLGITPDDADPDLGWIVPLGGASWPPRVESFREKPPQEEAASLAARGALVNSFIVVARGRTLMELFRRYLPRLTCDFVAACRTSARGEVLEELYRQIPCHDFSRDVLEQAIGSLRVLPVRPCGWSDLGTPQRVADCLARRPRRRLNGAAPPVLPYPVGAPLDLSRRIPLGTRSAGL